MSTMDGLVQVNNLEVVDGVSVAGKDVKAGEVLLHVPALVTGPGRGGDLLPMFPRVCDLTSVLQGGPSASLVTRLWMGNITAMAAPGSAAGRSASAGPGTSTGTSARYSGRGTSTPPGTTWASPRSPWTSWGLTDFYLP